ncbi:minor capsid protein [Alkalihalobacillus trypoxylicola]|uniref:Minor capsid protein n=1 Tax=Alkalihalobacillus trypoxylicola TaxID=519424 RepID=A0A162D5F1_9BACI|nr:minor capsid protein [Alkalihalobacillus trypoxylicola]KYG28176.1 hypothetical protein AZF04_09750 [Alkalihalobacillus trypoxylicola]
MSIRIRKDIKQIKPRLDGMISKGQFALTNQAHADMNLYVPMRSSDLRNQSSISPDGKSVTWNAPYSKKQYYNVGANYTTPGTGPRWDLKATGIHSRQWQEVSKRAMR